MPLTATGIGERFVLVLSQQDGNDRIMVVFISGGYPTIIIGLSEINLGERRVIVFQDSD